MTSSFCPEFPYRNTYLGDFYSPYITAYPFEYVEIADAPGIPGQCNPNPHSAFTNHEIAFIDGI